MLLLLTRVTLLYLRRISTSSLLNTYLLIFSPQDAYTKRSYK